MDDDKYKVMTMPRMYLMFKLAEILTQTGFNSQDQYGDIKHGQYKNGANELYRGSTNYILADKTERNLVVVDNYSQDKINSNC